VEVYLMINFPNYVSGAEKVGLPVNFLKLVRDKYSFSEVADSKANETSIWFNSMSLTASTTAQLQDLALEPYRAPGVETLYHESTHAWFDLQDDQRDVKQMIVDGNLHYRNAEMEDGSTASDSERLFQEAAGMYVGSRAHAWFLAMAEMDRITKEMEKKKDSISPDAKKLLIRQAGRIKPEYHKETGTRVFGYQTPIGSSSQVSTKKTILSSLRTFCDSRLLENMIPDAFDMNQKLVDKWNKLVAVLPEAKTP
jgi:hypothetical protein